PTTTTAPDTANVLADTNGNGTQDLHGPGLAGVSITLRDGGGNVVGTATSDAQGYYQFTVVPGNYTLTETQPAGYGDSTTDMRTISVPTAGFSSANFGDTLGSLSGSAFLDTHG